MPREFRVLQAMAGPNPGGAEAFFVRLARALRDAGIEQHLVVKRNAYAAQRLREAAFEPEELGFGGIFDLATTIRLRKSIARFQPQIVVTWMNRATRFCPRPRQARRVRSCRPARRLLQSEILSDLRSSDREYPRHR